jgi:hypothetical protein
MQVSLLAAAMKMRVRSQPDTGPQAGTGGADGRAPSGGLDGGRPLSDAGVAPMFDAGGRDSRRDPTRGDRVVDGTAAARDAVDASDRLPKADHGGCQCDLARMSRRLPWPTLALAPLAAALLRLRRRLSSGAPTS